MTEIPRVLRVERRCARKRGNPRKNGVPLETREGGPTKGEKVTSGLPPKNVKEGTRRADNPVKSKVFKIKSDTLMKSSHKRRKLAKKTDGG